MRAVVRILFALVALCVLAAGGAYFYIGWASRQPTVAESIVFEVPKGASLTKLGSLLTEAGHLPHPYVWQAHLKLHGGPPAKAGKHPLRAGMSIQEILTALAENPLPEDVPLTMVEGWRLVDADQMLAQAGWISPGEYKSAAEDPSRFNIPFPFSASNLEGYLYPETYWVPKGPLDVNKLIQRQIDAFFERFYKPHQEAIASGKRALHEIVIMASMLEREEPKPEIRPQVAGVLYKRLDAQTPLGVDATSRYSLEDWSDRRKFLQRLRDPNDAYNTRLKKGLPPGPIGAPSLPSLIASIRPVNSTYWYYLHDHEQTIHFSETAAEHEAKRKKFNVY